MAHSTLATRIATSYKEGIFFSLSLLKRCYSLCFKVLQFCICIQENKTSKTFTVSRHFECKTNILWQPPQMFHVLYVHYSSISYMPAVCHELTKQRGPKKEKNFDHLLIKLL